MKATKVYETKGEVDFQLSHLVLAAAGIEKGSVIATSLTDRVIRFRYELTSYYMRGAERIVVHSWKVRHAIGSVDGDGRFDPEDRNWVASSVILFVGRQYESLFRKNGVDGTPDVSFSEAVELSVARKESIEEMIRGNYKDIKIGIWNHLEELAQKQAELANAEVEA